MPVHMSALVRCDGGRDGIGRVSTSGTYFCLSFHVTCLSVSPSFYLLHAALLLCRLFDDDYLKYLGWMCSDRSPLVRREAVAAVYKLLSVRVLLWLCYMH